MGWGGLVRCGSSVGPGGDQAGLGALARCRASPAPAAGRALRRVWGWPERGGSAASMALDAGESRRGAGSGAGCGEGRKWQGRPGRCRRQPGASGRAYPRWTFGPARFAACGAARDPSAARWCIWAPQAARMVAERLRVQASSRGFGGSWLRGRARVGCCAVADGRVDRGGAWGAVSACEPVAGSCCAAPRLVEEGIRTSSTRMWC